MFAYDALLHFYTQIIKLLRNPHPMPLASTPQQSSWNSVWSEQVPALVMDQPISVNHDDWWQRLEKHGLVAGNMLTNNVEADRLYAAARGRRHSV